jgi:hypothetical protein
VFYEILLFFLSVMRQLKMKKYKTHPAHYQNHSSSHSEDYADDDGIGTKWYNVVSRLFIHQVCCLVYSWSTHTEEAKSMKLDAASDVATNDGDSISPILSKCDGVQCFFGWSH